MIGHPYRTPVPCPCREPVRALREPSLAEAAVIMLATACLAFGVCGLAVVLLSAVGP